MQKSTLLLLLVSTITIQAVPSAQKAQHDINEFEELVSSYNFRFTFVNEYPANGQFKITCTFADGSLVFSYINGASADRKGNPIPSNPLIFPSNSCLVGFIVEGKIPAIKYQAGRSYISSRDFSISHQNKNICKDTIFTIEKLPSDPYVQVNWE